MWVELAWRYRNQNRRPHAWLQMVRKKFVHTDKISSQCAIMQIYVSTQQQYPTETVSLSKESPWNNTENTQTEQFCVPLLRVQWKLYISLQAASVITVARSPPDHIYMDSEVLFYLKWTHYVIKSFWTVECNAYGDCNEGFALYLAGRERGVCVCVCETLIS